MLNRPLVWIACLYVLGLLAAASGPLDDIVISLPVVAAGFLIAAAGAPRHRLRLIGFYIVFFAVGACFWNFSYTGYNGDALSYHIDQAASKMIRLSGTVAETELFLPGEGTLSYVVDVDTVYDGDTAMPMRGRAKIDWYEPNRVIFAGERFEFAGKPSTHLGNVNPGINSYEDYLRMQRIYSRVLITDPKSVQKTGEASWFSLRYWSSRLRQAQAVRMRPAMPESTFAFVSAIWLGDRSRLSREETEAYRNSGTIHILSVSGLHMAMVYASANIALSIILPRRRLRGCALAVIIILFVMMTGAASATLRSGVMLLICIAYDLLDREPDRPSVLGLSALILLLLEPRALFDIGAQLSFLSVASLLLFQGKIADSVSQRIPYVLRESFAASFAVIILPMPLLVHIFHTVPIISPITNLLIIPLVTAIMWLAFATSLCAFVYLPVAMLFGYAMTPIVWAVRAIVYVMAATPISYFKTVSPTPLGFLGYCLAAIALYVALSQPERRRIAWRAFAGFVVFTVICWRPWFAASEVVFLDVGHGDATYICTPAGQTALIDAGNQTPSFDYGEKVVVPFLLSRGITHLDLVVGTHADLDHLGGLVHVIENIDVGAFVWGPGPHESAIEQRLFTLCTERGIPMIETKRGDAMSFEGIEIAVLHPPEIDADAPQTWRPVNDNDWSIVLRVRWPGVDLLLTGDIEAGAEKELVKEDCAATMLRVPHHGSFTSSTPALLDAVHPRVAIVSTGERHGRPVLNDGVIARYKDLGIPLWRTDIHGAVTLTVVDGTPQLLSERANRGYLAPHRALPD